MYTHKCVHALNKKSDNNKEERYNPKMEKINELPEQKRVVGEYFCFVWMQ